MSSVRLTVTAAALIVLAACNSSDEPVAQPPSDVEADEVRDEPADEQTDLVADDKVADEDPEVATDAADDAEDNTTPEEDEVEEPAPVIWPIVSGADARLGIGGPEDIHLPLHPVEIQFTVPEETNLYWADLSEFRPQAPTHAPTFVDLMTGPDTYISVFTLAGVVSSTSNRWEASTLSDDLYGWLQSPPAAFTLDGPERYDHPSGNDAFTITATPVAGSVFEQSDRAPALFLSNVSGDGQRYYGRLHDGRNEATYRLVQLDGTWVVVASRNPDDKDATSMFDTLHQADNP